MEEWDPFFDRDKYAAIKYAFGYTRCSGTLIHNSTPPSSILLPPFSPGIVSMICICPRDLPIPILFNYDGRKSIAAGAHTWRMRYMDVLSRMPATFLPRQRAILPIFFCLWCDLWPSSRSLARRKQKNSESKHTRYDDLKPPMTIVREGGND